MSYMRYALAAVGALGLVAMTEGARAQTLSSLVGAGPVTSGGLVYSNFTVGGNLPADRVNVNFTSNGVQFTANWNTITPNADNIVISYDVAVNPATGGTLSSSGLFFAGQVIVKNAVASVGETLVDTTNGPSGGPLYSMQVFYDGPGGEVDNLSDTVAFNPEVTQLHIVKSIDVAASQTFGSFAAINFVDNTFVNNPGGGVTPPIPEPMSLALLPLALVGLGLRKKLAR